MKKFFCLIAVIAAVCAVAGEKDECKKNDGNLHHIGRGFVNILTCPVELPRCMVYYNSDVPIWGVVNGAVTGSMRCVMRAFGGVTDILTLGFDPGRIYEIDNMREFVWQSPWLYQEPTSRWAAVVRIAPDKDAEKCTKK